MQDLISFVHNHPRLKREDLAGEVLALLLREEPGQIVLRSLISDVGANEDIEVVTRRVTEGCVPDVHLMRQGETVALLELKFWASITSHQLSGKYFDVAQQVVFIVPQERVSSVAEELSGLASSNRLTIISWKQALNQLELAMSGADTHEERLFHAALEHLKEFCNVMEEAHFRPFTAEQLRTPVQDTATEHLVWLTRAILDLSAKTGLTSEGGRIGAGFDVSFFFGQTVVIGGLRVWLGYWPMAWKRSPMHGPIWVQFYGREAATLLRAGSFTDGVRLAGNELAFPLFSTPTEASETQDDEVLAAVKTLSRLADRLEKLQLRAST